MISRDSISKISTMHNKDGHRARATSHSIPNGSTHAAFNMTKEVNEEDELNHALWGQLQMREDSEDIEDSDGPMAVGMHSRRSQIE